MPDLIDNTEAVETPAVETPTETPSEETAVVAAPANGVVEHADIRAKVKDLRSKVEEDYWSLSEALFEVYQNSYYVGWGFGTWKEYVEQELDFKLRKAQYLVSIQEWFGQLKPAVQKWAKELGWTKSKELVGIVTNDNAAEWKKKIKGLSMKQLGELLEAAEAAAKGEKPEGEKAEGAADKPTKISFSLFDAQKQNVALAIEKAKSMGNTDKDGHALDLICTEFLSTNGGSDTLAEYLAKIERTIGVKLVAFDQKEDAVVYGSELLDSLAGGGDAPAETPAE